MSAVERGAGALADAIRDVLETQADLPFLAAEDLASLVVRDRWVKQVLREQAEREAIAWLDSVGEPECMDCYDAWDHGYAEGLRAGRAEQGGQTP